MNPLNVFGEEKILGNIIHFCDKRTIQSARLVNKDWAQASLKIIAKFAFSTIENAYDSLRSFNEAHLKYIDNAFTRIDQAIISSNVSFHVMTRILKIEFALCKQRTQQSANQLLCEDLTPKTPPPHQNSFFKPLIENSLHRHMLVAPKENNWNDWQKEMANLHQAIKRLCKSLNNYDYPIEIRKLAQLLHRIEDNFASCNSQELESIKKEFTTCILNLPLHKMLSLSALLKHLEKQGLLPSGTTKSVHHHWNFKVMTTGSRIITQLMQFNHYLTAMHLALSIEEPQLRDQKMSEVIQQIHFFNFPHWMKARCLQLAPIAVSYDLAAKFFTYLLTNNQLEDLFFYLDVVHPLIRESVIESTLKPAFAKEGLSLEYLDLLDFDKQHSKEKPNPTQLANTVSQFAQAQDIQNEEEKSAVFMAFFDSLTEQMHSLINAFLNSETVNWKEGIEAIKDLKIRHELLIKLIAILNKNDNFIMAETLSNYSADLMAVDFFLFQYQPQYLKEILKDLLDVKQEKDVLDKFIARIKLFPDWESIVKTIDDYTIKQDFYEKAFHVELISEPKVKDKIIKEIDQRRVSAILKIIPEKDPKKLVSETEKLFDFIQKTKIYTEAFQKYKSQKDLLERLFTEMEDRNLNLDEFILDNSLDELLTKRYSD